MERRFISRRVLNQTKNGINKWIRNCTVPHYLKGNKVYFFEDELVKWVEKNRVQTFEEKYANKRLNFKDMKISRKDLYDLVWAEPMTTVSKRFGLSDNGLRKQCKLMNIPTPPAGYWAKLKNGIKTEVIPLSEENTGNKQITILHEIALSEKDEINLSVPVIRNKAREPELSNGDISSFVVPEVLFAMDPIIIDTKEKKRQDFDNAYLKKNPFKTRLVPL